MLTLSISICILVSSILLFILLLMPSLNSAHTVNAFKKQAFAHRGVYDNKAIPENSLPAFEQALKKGYGIELDVRITKDNKVIVFHDNMLTRMCSANLKVSSSTYTELQDYALLSSDIRIPLLEDVLKKINSGTDLLIELKTEGNSTRDCILLNNLLKSYNGWYAIQSFNPKVLLWYKKNAPHILRGQLSYSTYNLLTNFFTSPNFISHSCDNEKSIGFWICRRIYHATTSAWTVLEDNYTKELYDIIIFEARPQ